MKAHSYLPASWVKKPANVTAITTLISGGVSTGDFAEYNLATHVGDNAAAVKTNREKLVVDLKLQSEPVWLEQVHSNKVICIDAEMAMNLINGVMLAPFIADASVTTEKNVVCAVLTADCLPVFFCNNVGTEVAVAHAGWRGLHAGIISNTINAMKSSVDEIQVSFGPAIRSQVFEVGEEVFSAFMEKNAANEAAFVATEKGHYLCDIYHIARIELKLAGIVSVAGGNACTFSENQQFYSYRRQQNTGRMASLIWLK
ncbi:FIG00003370: Multicopper polyphenol oxidase [hydrothermal vent metagenome]|uniref:FIG00003370: Multicopper polyphenol oxidase n=1 Tax=hydrothermal vent metagenome TaxID=652676 RepID=A0A3B0WQH4_9ZZZZ